MLRRSALPILALVAGCSPEAPQECAPSDAPWVDFDGDGFPASVDCNDSDPNIHPAAFELCDGIDNNCNGLIDEGFPVGPDGFPDCDPVEICDGIDNNYNGLIDEGFPDFDGDGIADCLDDHCEVLHDWTSREVLIDPDCTEGIVSVDDPWNLGIEWQWSEGAATSGVWVTPSIGRFIDTNGDGVVDFEDTPSVAFTTLNQRFVVLRGDDGSVLMDLPGFHDSAGVALVDVDGDGEVDAVTMDNQRRPMVLDRFGNEKWRSSVADPNRFSSVIVADVDGDGVPEVITQTLMVRGDDGTLITNFGTPSGIPYYIPTVGDIDLDGEQEILIGRNVYRPDGTIKWSHTISGDYGHWAALVNYDDDPEAEIVVVGGGRIGLYEHDGTEIALISTDAALRPGPICVADFDGDGVVEMAWASRNVFSVFELDGRVIWSAPVEDFSGLAGCSGYDIDGDGAYEVLFADERNFFIFDGRDGTVRFVQPGHASATIFEYPAVADIDGDGSAEVVFVSNRHNTTTWGAVTAIGHLEGNWPPSGETWPVHNFAVTNVLPNGTVPASPEPSWLVHNVYRARPAADIVSANLQAEITDACVSGCTEGVGVAVLAVEVINNGASDVRIDIPLTVYAETGAEWVPLSTEWLRGGVPGGTRIGGVEFQIPIEDLERGFVVRVDDRGNGVGNVLECYEDDNETTWPYPVCD